MSVHYDFPRELRNYEIEESVVPWRDDLWEISTPPRLDWLKRLCMRIMTNIGALRPNVEFRTELHHKELQNAALLDQIFRAYHGLRGRYQPEDLVCVVGRDVWTGLLANKDVLRAVQWRVGPATDDGLTMFGFDVVHVPHIGGFCILPRSALTKRHA